MKVYVEFPTKNGIILVVTGILGPGAVPTYSLKKPCRDQILTWEEKIMSGAPGLS